MAPVPAIDFRLHPGVLACVAVGGSLGALARYGVARIIPIAPLGFPWATFVTNVTGAFVLGCFLTFVVVRGHEARFSRPLIAIGFLGGFTTFSTMAVETVTRVKDDHAALGIAYLLVSVVVGLAACWVGIVVGRAVARTNARGVS